MKDKIKEICNKLNREQLSVHGATEELLILFGVRASLECGRFSISEHPPIPDTDLDSTKNVIWMETNEGEGTTIDVEKLFEWAM